LNTSNETQPFEVVNDIGFTAYVDIVQKIEANGGSLGDPFIATVMACNVCLANALGPAISSAPDPHAAAETLIAMCAKRIREFVEPAVQGVGGG
jgi:hypothetical protein